VSELESARRLEKMGERAKGSAFGLEKVEGFGEENGF